MNICLMNDSFPPQIDGVSNAVLNYAEIITRSLGSCEVAIPEYPGVKDEYPFPVVRYPSLPTDRLVGYRAGMPLELGAIRRITERGPELLHAHCPVSSAILGRALRELTDTPLVLTYHTKFDIDIQNAIRGHLLQEAAIRLLVNNIEACDEVWVVSRGAGENLRSLGYEGEYRVMENGVDLSRGRPEKQEIAAVTGGYDLPEDCPVYLFVGRLMWYKGLRLILEGLRRLKSAGKPFRMVFVGGGGDEAEVRAEAERLGLLPQVIFTGPVFDREVLRCWYSRADLLLFPSTFDTFGLVVREAAACAVPALLIRDSCAAEGVTDGESGLLIPESGEALGEALLQSSRERLSRIGENAQQRLYLSWEDSVRRAWERYGTIREEWQSGVMPRRRLRSQPPEELTAAAAELYGVLEKARERLEKHVHHRKE